MNFKTGKRFNKLQKVVLISILLFGFSYITAIAQTSSAPISFIKQQVMFLKWGDGDKEVGLQVNQNEYAPGKTISKTVASFGIDGADNIYIADWVNNRIQIYDDQGKFKKTIKNGDLKNNCIVIGQDGDIYYCDTNENFDKDHKLRFVRIDSKENKAYKYEGNVGSCVLGNKVISRNGKTSFEMKDKKDFSFLEHRLLLFRDRDYTYDRKKKTFIIDKSSINNYLKTLGEKEISKEIEIHRVETGIKMGNTILGVGRDNFIYLNFAFIGEEYLQSEGVNVYDLNGSLVNSIPLEINQVDQDPGCEDVQLSPSGYLYQMWVSKNGVYIYKWSLSK